VRLTERLAISGINQEEEALLFIHEVSNNPNFFTSAPLRNKSAGLITRPMQNLTLTQAVMSN
jgi:hypothetical protein